MLGVALPGALGFWCLRARNSLPSSNAACGRSHCVMWHLPRFSSIRQRGLGQISGPRNRRTLRGTTTGRSRRPRTPAPTLRVTDTAAQWAERLIAQVLRDQVTEMSRESPGLAASPDAPRLTTRFPAIGIDARNRAEQTRARALPYDAARRLGGPGRAGPLRPGPPRVVVTNALRRRPTHLRRASAGPGVR